MSRLPNQSQKPEWLSELQQKSWEPEILLSGIVLYGMFQAPALLDQFLQFAKLNLYDNFTDLDNLIALLKIALYWLTIGLILHLISRGIWVGMVGLSYTFPQGIDKSKLKLSSKFEKHVEKIPPIEQIIMNLEKLCSSLFAVSFLMFMMIIGGYFFFFAMVIVPVMGTIFYLGPQNLNESFEPIIIAYVYSILTFGVIGLFDFVTLGLLKRYKWTSKIYYPIYKVISTLTLARFYRPIYYTLISNYNRWKIGGFLIVFIFSSFFLFDKTAGNNASPGESWSRLTIWSNAKGASAFSGYYDDQNDDFHSVQAQIQSDIISENTIRLFTVLRIGLEDSIKKNCNYDSLIVLDTASHYIDIHCMSSFYNIHLDGKKQQNLTWRFLYKQKTNQRGLITYLDITELPQGDHMLTVKGPDNMFKSTFAEIPFYREISRDGYYAPMRSKPNEEESYLKLKPILPK